MLVILGTAHDEFTAGKRSPDGRFREWAYSRRLCSAIAKRLNSMGIETHIDIIENREISLQHRCDIVNGYYKNDKNMIYVSVHVNAASNGDWKNATGWSVYTTKGVTKADCLANCLYEAAKEVLEPQGKKIRTDFYSDGDADYEENFYVLKHTIPPAVLTENFFQDCKADVEWLESEEGFNSIVELHVRGIIKYIES